MPREAQFRSPKHIFYPFGGPWARDPKNWKRNTAVAVAVYGTALYCFASYADRYAKRVYKRNDPNRVILPWEVTGVEAAAHHE